jgi:hypothetical protein
MLLSCARINKLYCRDLVAQCDYKDAGFGLITGFIGLLIITNKSAALVRERTIPTERPPLVGEVTANFCG